MKGIRNDPGFEPLLSPSSGKQRADEKSALLKITILQNQLKEGETKKSSKERIFKEIVIDLMNEYLDLSRSGDVESLYEKYKDVIEKDTGYRALFLKVKLYKRKGEMCAGNYEWDKALEYYMKSEKIAIEVGDKAGFGTTYNNIGLIYSKKGEWNTALEKGIV